MRKTKNITNLEKMLFVGIAGALLGAFVMQHLQVSTTVGTGITRVGYFCDQVRQAGDVRAWDDIQMNCHRNLITNVGKDDVKLALSNKGFATTANSWYLNLSNQTLANCTVALAAADTAICGGTAGNLWTTCGVSTQSGVYTDRGVGNWSTSSVWTSSCASVTVNATAIQNFSNNGGNASQLFAESTITNTTLNSGDQINITYYTWVT